MSKPRCSLDVIFLAALLSIGAVLYLAGVLTGILWYR